MLPQYGELRPTRGWDRLGSLGHHSYFQRLSRLGSVTARQSSSERQPNFAVLNRGRHLCSAGRPSRWAFAHISSCILVFVCDFAAVMAKQRYSLVSISLGPYWHTASWWLNCWRVGTISFTVKCSIAEDILMMRQHSGSAILIQGFCLAVRPSVYHGWSDHQAIIITW